MKPGNWKDTAELIGIAAIVASLVFVGLQMMQARDIAISDGNLANAANKIERNNAIVQNPDIWVRGNAGEELNQEDAAVFRYLIQNVVDTAFFEIVRMRRLGADDIVDDLIADFSAFLYGNPGARQIWIEDESNIQKYRLLLIGTSNQGHLDFAETVRTNLSKLGQSVK